MKALVLLLYFINIGEARDVIAITFLDNYVRNEIKPSLIMCHLCWDKSFEVKLQKQLFKSGLRTSNLVKLHEEYSDHTMFIINLDCPTSEELLLNIPNEKLLSPYRWLALQNVSSEGPKSLLWDLLLYVDSDFVLAERIGDTFTMNELYKPSTTGSTRSTPRGYFNNSFADTRPYRELFRRRRDVMGHPLTVSNVIQDTNATQYRLPREDREYAQFDTTAKLTWMSVKLALLMLNATPRYIFTNRYGYQENGTWSGMIKDLKTGAADIGSTCIANKERLQVVVWTDNLAPFKVKFIFRQPPLPYVANIFSLPFSTNVWLTLSVCAVISTMTFYTASRWEAREGEEKDSSKMDGSLGDAMLLTMCALSQQGCFFEPRIISGRLMLFVVFAALMALYAAYSANIVVLLQAPSNAIKNLEQLAYSKLTIAANDVDYSHFIFKMHKDPVRLEIMKKLYEKNRPKLYELNEGVEKVRQGLFAFHSIVEPLYLRVEQTFMPMEKCDLVEIDFLNGFDPVIPVKKDTPYLELLKVTFKQVREAGISSALAHRMQASKPVCSDSVAAFSSVGFRDLRYVLLLMIYGAIISCCIAVAEFVVFRLRRNKYWKDLAN